MKKFLCFFLSAVMAFCALPAGFTVAVAGGSGTISAGQTVTVTLDYSGDVYVLRFTPEKSGAYRVLSHLGEDITDPYCIFNDSGGRTVIDPSLTDDTVYEDGTRSPNFDFTVDLTAGEQYTIVCMAANISDTVSYTVEIIEVIQPPAAPTGLTVSALTQTSFKLDWDDVSGVVSYTVYDPSTDPTTARTVTESEYAFSGLTPATEYTVRVTATDEYGQVSSAAQIQVTTLANEAPEVTAPELSATEITQTGFRLAWNSVSGAEYYIITDITGGDETHIATITDCEYTFTNLSPQTSYTIRVTAANKDHSASSQVTVTTLEQEAPEVSAPEITALNITPTSFKLVWNSVSGSEHYVITDITGGDETHIATIAGCEYEFTDLSPQTSYTIRVTAANKDHSASSEISVTTQEQEKPEDPDPDDPDEKKPSAPSGFRVYGRGDGGTDLYLSWNAAKGADVYRVYILNGEEQEYKGSTAESRFIFTDLDPAAAYSVLVIAENEYGTASAQTAVCTAPAAVTGLTAAAGGNTITANWNGTDCDGYVIQWSTSPSFSRIAGSATVNGADVTEKTFSAQNAGKYYVRIRAWKNDNGVRIYGDFSAPAKVN